MTLEELYAQIGGDYAEALSRLRMDKLIGRFVVKFLDDTTCDDLVRAWEAGDAEAAFHAAHSAKGVCMNLALTRLGEPASQITEALRPGNDALRAQTDVDGLVKQLAIDYAATVAAIKEYQAQQG